MDPIKVLLVAADPFKQQALNIPEEFRDVQKKVRSTKERGVEFETALAVLVGDIQTELLHHRPDVVHFSGHGTDSSELILQTATGQPQAVSSKALTSLLGTFKKTVRLVVLNACFSADQAKDIVSQVDFAIGMNAPIDDEAAICFSTAFYEALASGESIRTAFKLGTTAIALAGIPEDSKPQLYSRADLGPQADAMLRGQAARAPWWQAPTTLAYVTAGATIVGALISIAPSLVTLRNPVDRQAPQTPPIDHPKPTPSGPPSTTTTTPLPTGADKLTAECDAGNTRSCEQVGNSYRYGGSGVDKDTARAVAFYQKACEGGRFEVCYDLAYMYADGSAGTKDEARAERLYHRACDGGYTSGCRALALIYIKRYGFKDAEMHAASPLEQACAANDSLSCSDLGYLYETDDGVPRDYKRAAEFYQKACKLNHSESCDSVTRVKKIVSKAEA